MEAAAAARPVLSTRVGGVPEVVEDGVTGVLVEPDDVAALVGALCSLAATGELRQQLGQCAHAHARRYFGIERQVEATLDLWRSLTQAGGP
jgi:glycosyltransferase involved in cell wall biosynthesis